MQYCTFYVITWRGTEPSYTMPCPYPDPNEFPQAAEDASFFLRRDGEGSDAYARRVFGRVFTSDIERVLRMEVLVCPLQGSCVKGFFVCMIWHSPGWR